MAVKVHFEIGHTAKLKSKKTPDGFTHDWELYVRGTDKSDISHFVEKVVFNLHDSFPKPKRVVKEAPYVLKESGYAGFVLPIDIHFKNRDEPKRVTFNYDLDLQQTGPPVHRNEIKKYTFNNPSDDFRRKLLKGGGIPLVNNADEKSRDSVDERSQSSKPKLNNDEMKKLKIRPEESPRQTFTKLFGTPIKTSSKVSPDPKNKSSPSLSSVSAGGKSNKISEKSSSATSALIREKLEKTEKKDKHKHNSPHKDKLDGIIKENKKNSAEEKHERRTEKKKDKSHSKERDRSREKSSKRPLSPKRLPSPKRPSPVRSSSAASRGEENGFKPSIKTNSDLVGLNNNNNSEKLANSGSSASKKSKKEKKSYDKDREREKKEKERERKDKEERGSNNSTPIVAPSVLNHAANLNTKAPNNEIKQEYNKKDKDNIAGPSKDLKDLKKAGIDMKLPDIIGASDKKIVEKHDKDAEKRHKHKKKDKNKEKDKDKDYALKDKKKDKSSKKDDIKKTPQSQTINEPAIPPQKSSTNSSANAGLVHDISDGDSPDSDVESPAPSISERPENITESSNSSLQDIVTKPTLPVIEEPKIDKRKAREKTKVEKEKRKRKNKEEIIDTQSRKSASPAINSHLIEPPIKQSKKDELTLKNGEKSNSPQLSTSSTSSSNNSLINPSSNQPLSDDSTAFRAPSTSTVPLPSTSNNNSQQLNERSSLTGDYMSELRDLQQKIMTLQDSNELQQVVEMIAATGQFEVTSKTFDFDLCKLDRNTVQKLQNFFATSCS